MVILKQHQRNGYTELQFGEPKQAMEGIDLIKYDALRECSPKIEVWGKGDFVVTQCSMATQ